MKNITRDPFLDGAPVVFETLKTNHTDLASGLASVRHRQLPAACADDGNISAYEVLDFDGEEATQDTLRGTFTTAATAWGHPPFFPASPTETFLPDDNLSPGWNPLSLALTEGHTVVLPTKPGIVTGFACVDSELRCSVSDPYPAFNPYTNKDLWWQFGVFANGQLISLSQKLIPGRHSITIPFATFTGAELTRFEVKFRVYFGTLQLEDATGVNREPLAFYSSCLFAKYTGA